MTEVAEAEKTKTERKPPNRKRLTEKNIRTLRAKSKQYLVWDDPAGKDSAYGLAVMVSPRGVKSYRCVYYFPGSPKPHWKHLGRVGELTLNDVKGEKTGKIVRKGARSLTVDVRRMAKEGGDPKADDPRKSDNFRAMVEDYTQDVQVGERENLRAKETQQVILGHTRDWHARAVATIRRDEIKNLLRRVRDGSKDRRGTPYLANRLHAHLKDFFAWAADPDGGGQLKESPMAGMGKPWKKEKPRQRDWFKGKAGDRAMKSIWRAADDIGGERGRYVKMMLLTGKRRGALAAMRWEEVEADGFWRPPESRARNKRTNVTPLSRLALRVLGSRRAEGPVFEGLGNLGLLALRVRDETGIDDFIWHGLRHLCETKTAEMVDADERAVIPANVRDLLFDHAPQRGTGKVYDHHDYRAEMRAAAEAWAGYVEGLISRPGVTRLA